MPSRHILSRHRIYPVFILCLCFGIFGVHRFYLQKFATGVLQLLTLGGLGMWTIIDLLRILTGNFDDEMGFQICRWS